MLSLHDNDVLQWWVALSFCLSLFAAAQTRFVQGATRKAVDRLFIVLTAVALALGMASLVARESLAEVFAVVLVIHFWFTAALGCIVVFGPVSAKAKQRIRSARGRGGEFSPDQVHGTLVALFPLLYMVPLAFVLLAIHGPSTLVNATGLLIDVVVFAPRHGLLLVGDSVGAMMEECARGFLCRTSASMVPRAKWPIIVLSSLAFAFAHPSLLWEAWSEASAGYGVPWDATYGLGVVNVVNSVFVTTSKRARLSIIAAGLGHCAYNLVVIVVDLAYQFSL